MASNQDKIVNFYNTYAEDARATKSPSGNIEFYYTEKLVGEFIKPDAQVLELGCGTGHYGMIFADRCHQYTAVDLSPHNIDIFNRKISTHKKLNLKTMVGDATRLDQLDNDSFDVVLCLGPMYHLPEDERSKVFDECRRVARDGAIMIFAYINRLGAYVGACIHDPLRDIYPNADANRYVFEESTDDVNTGIFFYTSPEEMEQAADGKGLQVLKHCGVDFFFTDSAVDQMDAEQLRCFPMI
ncbi:MAG: class I SAM-dependent methyltransferase [Lachnospiraceae bacterium]|jgi:ubiquinone/menaquinone biosynthesis C-methylase UbiE|nr:class I SAM-dependent methyltransferase [Lachnospiraceae bacterium]